jgi:hypothetical protein
MYTRIHIYIYIYTYTHTHICIYIYLHAFLYMYITGSHFLKKDIQDRNPKKAVSLLENSCNANHAPSCFNLAVLFKKGIYIYIYIHIYVFVFMYVYVYICM